MNTPVITDQTPKPALAIVERYEGAVNYLYPLLLNMSHKHRVLRDSMIAALFEQYRLFYEAAKSSQVSRVYVADAGLAHIKELLRFMADPARKLASFAASGDFVAKSQFLGAWLGHARHANTSNLLIHLGVDK